ncbi:MAG: ATP/GTP-binding protein [Aigarchaeota archaeon]|nr:ATP/GTP-binding protein [Aigarchaeota archaeon]MCX8193517.1 ATP/GTP-binding protein [Nitrososphaeria archaeon]MDW7986820.1 ATP/GTP-binding protein [Nitrososphaerota archaeon]
MNLVFVGTAGCGKSSLTYRFGKWLEEELAVKVSYINLDPGAYNPQYKPSYDIREIITVEELIREGLGPNGAMIRAAEIIEERINEVSREILSLQSDFKLIDTPGQMELFLFRSMGPRFVEEIGKQSITITIYIMDPVLASSPSGLAVSLMLSLITRFRLKVPVISIVNKSDLREIEYMEKYVADLDYLKSDLVFGDSGIMVDLAMRYVEIVDEFSKNFRIVKVSAKTGYGMSDLYTMIHEAICECGDMT